MKRVLSVVILVFSNLNRIYTVYTETFAFFVVAGILTKTTSLFCIDLIFLGTIIDTAITILGIFEDGGSVVWRHSL